MKIPTGAVSVEVYNPNKNKSEWLPGLVIGTISGDALEDFERAVVRMVDGREFRGVHPECLRPDMPF